MNNIPSEKKLNILISKFIHDSYRLTLFMVWTATRCKTIRATLAIDYIWVKSVHHIIPNTVQKGDVKQP